MLDWSEISTVLLDMDGTILDLHYDNYFWQQHLPIRYAEKANISVEQAKQRLSDHYQRVEGTLAWYCLDYWQAQLDMPILTLKREISHLIQLRDDAANFMTALKQSGRQVILVTNAHPDSLSLKIEQTQLDSYFDHLYSTHEFGVSKESQQLWQQLQKKVDFDTATTLFVDDSVPILKSAKKYGIKHLLAVENPDSKKQARQISEFNSTANFNEFTAKILATAKG